MCSPSIPISHHPSIPVSLPGRQQGAETCLWAAAPQPAVLTQPSLQGLLSLVQVRGTVCLFSLSCSRGQGSQPGLSQAGGEAEVPGAADLCLGTGIEQLHYWRHCQAATCLAADAFAARSYPSLSLKPGFRLCCIAPAPPAASSASRVARSGVPPCRRVTSCSGEAGRAACCLCSLLWLGTCVVS